jgi:hypothetical protein
MPLSPPGERQPLHTRRYEFNGYRRADRLWELEGGIVDLKAYAFDNDDRGRVEPGTPVHQMAIRLTLDDGLTIKAIEAVTDHGPYHVCPAITPNFQRMVGVRIGPGWRKAIRERLGGAEGCTHLVELLIAMATPAYQTILPVLSRERRAAKDPTETWPGLINSCHAYRDDGPLAKKYWPERYKGA